MVVSMQIVEKEFINSTDSRGKSLGRLVGKIHYRRDKSQLKGI